MKLLAETLSFVFFNTLLDNCSANRRVAKSAKVHGGNGQAQQRSVGSFALGPPALQNSNTPLFMGAFSSALPQHTVYSSWVRVRTFHRPNTVRLFEAPQGNAQRL